MRVVLGPDGPLLDRTPPRRPPGEHAVRVRIEVAGVCRSDLKEVAGDRHGVSQFGHEIVGVVEESTVPDVPPGRRVTLDPNASVERGTGFATEMWAAGPADRLITALPPVPRHLPSRRLVFAEPLACASHCLSAAARHLDRDLTGARLGVLGAGTAGVLIAALAQAMDVEVLLANRSPDRRSFLHERGVLDGPVELMAAAPADSFDVVVVATSFVLPEILRQALRMAAPGGLVLLYGGTAPGDAVPGLACDLDTVRRRQIAVSTSWRGKPVRIGGSYGTVRDDFDAALRALAGPATSLPGIERMITREIRLPDLPHLLQDQSTTRHLGKTLVLP